MGILLRLSRSKSVARVPNLSTLDLYFTGTQTKSNSKRPTDTVSGTAESSTDRVLHENISSINPNLF